MQELEKLKNELKSINAEYAKIKDIAPEKRGEFGREMNARKNDILARQFAWLYDFSAIKEWDKEKKDKEGILIYSELVDYSNEGDESYKINYSYGYCGDYSTKNIVNTSHTEYEGEVYESERNYIITETYLHTDVDPRGGK